RRTVRRPPRAALLGPREHGVLALLAERHVGRHERLARGAARRRLHLQGRDRSLALSRTEGHPHRPAGPDRPRGVHVICVPDTRPGLVAVHWPADLSRHDGLLSDAMSPTTPATMARIPPVEFMWRTSARRASFVEGPLNATSVVPAAATRPRYKSPATGPLSGATTHGPISHVSAPGFPARKPRIEPRDSATKNVDGTSSARRSSKAR